MKIADQNYAIQSKIARRWPDKPVINYDDINTLRRAELTLQSWAELECGTDDGNGNTVNVEQDEKTGRWYRYWRGMVGNQYIERKHRTADRETGAKRRVEQVCKANGLQWYIQSDPRGCAVYVGFDPINDNDYPNTGIAVCA